MRSDCLKDKAEAFDQPDGKSLQANTDFTVMLGFPEEFLEYLPHCLMWKW